MAEMLIKSESLVSIADKIRVLSGTEDDMSLNTMETNLETEYANIVDAFDTVANKGGTVPSSKISGNLATAISSIPSGAIIQRKTGTFTTNTSGDATINCGLYPDIVCIRPFSSPEPDILNNISYEGQLCFLISEKDGSKRGVWNIAANSQGWVNGWCLPSNNGFTMHMTKTNYSLVSDLIKNTTFNYIAIKYTE